MFTTSSCQKPHLGQSALLHRCFLQKYIVPGRTHSRGAVRSAASSYAAMRMLAGSRPVLVIAWEWHIYIGLALLCGCSGALEYPTTNSCGPINKSLSLYCHTVMSEISNRIVGKILLCTIWYHGLLFFRCGVYKYCYSVYRTVSCGESIECQLCEDSNKSK